MKQQVKHLTKEEYNILRELCRTAKNLKMKRFTIFDNIIFKKNNTCDMSQIIMS